VERGETITITKHGREPVNRPSAAPDEVAAALRAANRGAPWPYPGAPYGRGRPPLMPMVIDTSLTMAWCFEDEATDDSDAILDLVLAERLATPLATLAARLATASRNAGVDLLIAS
jgi:hypothetical protein